MLRVFGGVGIDGHGTVRSPAQRTLLAALALDGGTIVSTDRLADLIWSEEQPANPTAALQNQVSRVRALLPGGASISAAGQGYRLDVEPAGLDVAMFDSGFRRACAAPATDCLELVDQALALWTGSPFADLGNDDRALAETARLETVRLSLRELKAESLLAAHRVYEAIGGGSGGGHRGTELCEPEPQRRPSHGA